MKGSLSGLSSASACGGPAGRRSLPGRCPDQASPAGDPRTPWRLGDLGDLGVTDPRPPRARGRLRVLCVLVPCGCFAVYRLFPGPPGARGGPEPPCGWPRGSIIDVGCCMFNLSSAQTGRNPPIRGAVGSLTWPARSVRSLHTAIRARGSDPGAGMKIGPLPRFAKIWFAIGIWLPWRRLLGIGRTSDPTWVCQRVRLDEQIVLRAASQRGTYG